MRNDRAHAQTLKFDNSSNLLKHKLWRYFLHTQIIVTGVELWSVGAGPAADVSVKDGEYGFADRVGACIAFIGWAI